MRFTIVVPGRSQREIYRGKASEKPKMHSELISDIPAGWALPPAQPAGSQERRQTWGNLSWQKLGKFHLAITKRRVKAQKHRHDVTMPPKPPRVPQIVE